MKTLLGNLVLSYLRFWARVKLLLIQPKIIGVTGSVGKSSAVSLISSIGSLHYRVKNTLHGNSESGIPLEVLGLRGELDNYSVLTWIKIILLAPVFALIRTENWNLLVVEMGIDSPYPPKNMGYLLKLIKPDVGVFLNVAPVHAGQFAEMFSGRDRADLKKIVAAIALEKGQLVTELKPDGTAIIGSDYPEINRLKKTIRAKTITFGENPDCDFALVGYKSDLGQGTQFNFRIYGKTYRMVFPETVLFKQYGLTLLAALAAGEAVGIPIEESYEKLRDDFRLPPGRFSILNGKKQIKIIDSSYNSSPESLADAVSFLKACPKPRVAILGDMRELGDSEADLHRNFAEQLGEETDFLVLVGPKMLEFLLPELLNTDFDRKNLFAFQTSEKVGEFVIDRIIKKGGTVLVKGSQNTIFLEEAVAEMLDNPADKKLLCREDAYWQKVRRDFFSSNPNRQIYPANK